MDKISESRIDTIHPAIRDYARNFLTEAENAGIILRITAGYRTFEEQDHLYAQGRTAPGKIVTNAKGGDSPHNYGLAIDVVPMVGGQPDWDSALWEQISDIGKDAGFAWGGDFKSFKDKPHFEKLFGLNIYDLRKLYDTGRDTDGYIKLP